MALTSNQVREAIQQVKNPKADKPLSALGFIKDVKTDGDFVQVVVTLPESANDQKEAITAAMKEAIAAYPGGDSANVTVSYMVGEDTLMPGIKHIILVASGKGGVGKSTVAVNLAYALKYKGHSVGLIDADIYGPSVPMMLHMERPRMTENENGKPLPPTVGDIPVMSIGFFVDPGQGVIWRGPMLHSALKQFFDDFEWGELDYMVIDLPPGTGDVQISISHLLQNPVAVLVTTPQNVALADVTRAHNMFEKVNIEVMGLIENMSTFICPDNNKEYAIFGQGGGKIAADQMGVPFLGSLPIEPKVAKTGDDGWPIVLQDTDSPVSRRFIEIAEKLVETLNNHVPAAVPQGSCSGCSGCS